MAGTLLAVPTGAGAQVAPGSAESHDDARLAFAEGSAHFEGRKYTEALAAFERSYRVIQSPNALLMMARCQRELGRRPDAVATFDRAVTEARHRVANGENKYVPTAEAASDEANKLRSALGTIRVRVEGSTSGTVIADGKAVALSPAGEAVLLHEPGTASIEFSARSGTRHQQTVTVLPGSSVSMAFTADERPPPLSGSGSGSGSRSPTEAPFAAPTTAPTSSRFATPAWIAGGVTVLGAATFAGFGSSSKATYDELARRCGPSSCGPLDRDDANRGARAQTIANVGLGIALSAAVATVVFVVLALDESRSAPLSR